LVVFAIITFDKLRIDDPVGAISVHGAVGIWGLLAVPITNTEASLSAQLIGMGTILAWVFSTSFIVWLIIKLVMGLRVGEAEEWEGVDVSECGLEAYPEFVGAKGSGI
jgi:Amt family ammonium transporter